MQCCASRQPRLPHLFEQPAPEPALVPNTTGTASAEHLNVRNRELSALKLKELRRRAADSGATEDEIEGAEEGESVKAALIGLVVAKELEVAAPRQEARKRELSALKLKELRRRAVEVGATEDEIEGAEESESVKAALVELVVAKEPPPDRGAVAEAAKAAAAAAANRMLAALEQELGQLKLKEIRRRAADSGAAEDEIEDAEESEDVRAALVALVVSHTRKGTPVADLSGAEPAEQSPGDASQAEQAAQLGRLKLSALRRRAMESGASAADIEEAEDSDDMRVALIALLVATPVAAGPVAMAKPADDAADEVRDELGSMSMGALPTKQVVAAEICGGAGLEELRGELMSTKLSSLKKRARAEGLAEDESLSLSDYASVLLFTWGFVWGFV
jgi:hypothetical protein